MLLFSAILLCTICASCWTQESNCTTPDGGLGICRPLSTCPHLRDLIAPGKTNEERESFVRRRICDSATTLGRETRVCCNDCYTPDGKAGLCTPPESCPHIKRMLDASTDLYYVQNSICRSGETRVCCGPAPGPVVRGRCLSHVNAFPPHPASLCCGYDSESNTKIKGGNDTTIAQYPWLALLEYKLGNTVNLDCGGSLISMKYVLTAAHCIVGRRTTDLVSVRLGEFDTSNDGTDCYFDDCADLPVSIPIAEKIPHSEYNPDTSWNDIGLLRLAYAANYTDFIRPICLPWSDATANPKLWLTVYTAGFGLVDLNTLRSKKKQHVDLPLVKTAACQRLLELNSDKKITLWSNQLCAGGVQGKDSCEGDSGGPLMVDREVSELGSDHKAYEIIGVVSYGLQDCGTAKVPGVYTKVVQYNHWIRSHLRP